MTADAELLELAAKAAGIVAIYPFGPGEIYVRWAGLWAARDTSDEHGALKVWDPLTDDGDALRLAAKLYLWEAVRLAHRFVSADVDIYAATRRAIVLAAAEIGRAMP